MFALLLFARFLVAGGTGLTDDEAYYRLWSLALSPSYLDHPPMVALLIRLGRTLAGDSEFGVRLLAPVLLALGGIVLARMARLYAGDAVATQALWFFLAMPLLAVGGVIITPDLPSVFYYGLVVWTLFELSRSQNPNWWLATGIFSGLGLLSKYTNLFLGVTILIWLLAVPENRRWFRSWQLWAGGALAILLFVPVVSWNMGHDWASFAKQFGRVTRDADFGFKYSTEMAGGYLALASPAIAALSGWGFARIVRRAVSARASGDVLISASILPLLLYFAIHALHGRVQANWLAPIYPLLALCAAIAVIEGAPSAWRASTLLAARALGFLMVAVIYMHALVPIFDFRKDPTGQMRGWRAFAATIEKLLRANDGAWIATSSYATTAQLSFAYKGRPPVVQLNEPLRHESLPQVDAQVLARPGLYVELERRENRSLLDSCFAAVRRLVSAVRGTSNSASETYAVYSVTGLKTDCIPPGGFHAEATSAP